MAANAISFIHKDGRVIPIHASGGGAGSAVLRHTVGAAKGAQVINRASSLHKSIKQHARNPAQDIKVNKGLDLLGLGASVAAGVLGAATFSSGTKGFLAGALGGHALDFGGVAANIASVAGQGKTKERAKQGARQEARNFIVGNAVYAAGVLGSAKNRATLVSGTKKILRFAKNVLSVE